MRLPVVPPSRTGVRRGQSGVTQHHSKAWRENLYLRRVLDVALNKIEETGDELDRSWAREMRKRLRLPEWAKSEAAPESNGGP